jgi:YD repeat-containing protein
MEYLDKTEYPAERHKNRDREFGTDGNLIKEIFYDYRGNPSSVIVFGYLNGKRVLRSGPSIRHSYDPPPMIAPPGTFKPEPKGDDRYTSAWEYKYDKTGRIIEELRYNSSGVATYRISYEYGDKTEKRTTCNVPCSGIFSFLELSILDADGRVIKLESHNPQTVMDPDSVTMFRYLEFDSVGNWTKREATGTRSVSRDGTKPIHYVEYRTFTYF